MLRKPLKLSEEATKRFKERDVRIAEEVKRNFKNPTENKEIQKHSSK